MKLTILTENTAGGRFGAEHGLSYLIEHDGRTILFDTGSSDLFLRNAQKLNIKLQEKVDLIVLSHGHWDHGDGLRYFKNKPLLTHPGAFIKRFRKSDGTAVGLSLSESSIHDKYKVITSSKPYRISEHIYFLGEIPRQNNFESQSTSFMDETEMDDFVPDDSALAIINNQKLTVITGCSHSGICNICEYAKQITGISTIERVIGGFHLKHNDEQTQQTIGYFHQEKVNTLLPSHCTELPALAAFSADFGISQVKTGQLFNFTKTIK
ncbi:MBL fold metallo-hydrolase [uncultured Sunxiuqinia sp.]|uniref:MBL fold metallo-hydrolase n=1 Tax=uncultured Sunxiuqinia sp. TaxID=1573825 RepID=UPI002AA618BF|nr:MBL fold metallo-hydrolase [uncultured Sunxiuqinia sp.]